MEPGLQVHVCTETAEASNVNYQAGYPFLYRELEGISLDELAEIVDCRSDWRIQYDGMLSGRYGYPSDFIAHVFLSVSMIKTGVSWSVFSAITIDGKQVNSAVAPGKISRIRICGWY